MFDRHLWQTCIVSNFTTSVTSRQILQKEIPSSLPSFVIGNHYGTKYIWNSILSNSSLIKMGTIGLEPMTSSIRDWQYDTKLTYVPVKWKCMENFNDGGTLQHYLWDLWWTLLRTYSSVKDILIFTVTMYASSKTHDSITWFNDTQMISITS